MDHLLLLLVTKPRELLVTEFDHLSLLPLRLMDHLLFRLYSQLPLMVGRIRTFYQCRARLQVEVELALLSC